MTIIIILYSITINWNRLSKVIEAYIGHLHLNILYNLDRNDQKSNPTFDHIKFPIKLLFHEN